MAEATNNEVSIKKELLPFQQSLFFTPKDDDLIHQPPTEEEFNLASKFLSEEQKFETISITQLYRSKNSIKELKNNVPLSIFNEITTANGIVTVIGSSVDETNPERLNKQRRIISTAIADVSEKIQHLVAISGGGSRGAMLDPQLAGIQLWVREFRKDKSKDPAKIRTNLVGIGVGPDIYMPAKSHEHQEMPTLKPGPAFDNVLSVDTSNFNGGKENAWPPTSIALTILPELRKKGVKEITIVAGGGSTTQFEALNKLRFDNDIVVIKNSGRFADLLFEVNETIDSPVNELRPQIRVLRHELESIILTRPTSKQKDLKIEIKNLLNHVHFIDMNEEKDEGTHIKELTQTILTFLTNRKQ
ncbi:MAG TPA: hypothetical protein VLE44_00185 [Candidatus Saccharimonadales bacterium]|nr:hypothetical protein [Candidatus Saccharimonadales bacterium]